METEIVFCERCGVSIPEQEVVKARQVSGGRDLCPNCVSPARSDSDLQLYFCENCRVSIAVSDVLTGTAKPEGPGYLCTVCSRSSPAERVARKTAVEQELAAPADGAPGRGPDAKAPSVPIYFCDACNASIPAPLVATGRALVSGGRTYCELCRPRLEARHHADRPGVGVAPMLAAALLASVATAGGLVALERWRDAEAGKEKDRVAEDGVASLRRDLRVARESGDTSREIAERTERALRELERRVDGLRGEAVAARAATDKAVAQAAPGEKVGRLERQLSEMEDSIDALREEVAAVAAMRMEAPPKKSEPPVAKAPPTMPEDPVGPVPAGAPPALAPDVQRCILLLKDKEAATRFSAAIELGKLGERQAWPALAASLRSDDDPFVRRACARSIGELKAFGAFPDLVESLMDGEEYVAIQASRVIKEMAGQDFGFKQNLAKGEKKKVVDRAKKWWEENKTRLAPGAKD
jgi:hypothetical protein